MRFRFSLLTLLLASIAAGCAYNLYLHRHPWVLVRIFPLNSEKLLDASDNELVIHASASVSSNPTRRRMRGAYSPDGHYSLVVSDDNTAMLFGNELADPEFIFSGFKHPLLFADFTTDGEHILTRELNGPRGRKVWERMRPPQWWGIFHLRHFWIFFAVAGAAFWSFLRDRRMK